MKKYIDDSLLFHTYKLFVSNALLSFLSRAINAGIIKDKPPTTAVKTPNTINA